MAELQNGGVASHGFISVLVGRNVMSPGKMRTRRYRPFFSAMVAGIAVHVVMLCAYPHRLTLERSFQRHMYVPVARARFELCSVAAA